MDQQPEPDRPVRVCLCLETFREGDRPYVNLTPARRGSPTSMVCCNDCWLRVPMFQRALLSLLGTPPADGGLMLGPLVHERFWPDILQDVPEPPPVDLAPEPESAFRPTSTGDFYDQVRARRVGQETG